MKDAKRAMPGELRISVVPGRLAVCRLPPSEPLPAWAAATEKGSSFLCVVRTADELSVVCAEEQLPPGVACERGWRALKLEGVFDFSCVGVLVTLAAPLADEGISLLAVSTYNTDYVLVREQDLEAALLALARRGIQIVG